MQGHNKPDQETMDAERRTSQLLFQPCITITALVAARSPSPTQRGFDTGNFPDPVLTSCEWPTALRPSPTTPAHSRVVGRSGAVRSVPSVR